ncbi:MAG: cyclic nucleotide-binding domain-containing protein, partial [Gammaproteobacteria bacterium]
MSEDKEQYIESIKQLIPINELSPQLQTEVIDSANVVKHKKKQFVFNQGDKDNYSFYLLEGELELLADKKVRNKIVSGTDGALYPMAQLQPRQFSAKAKTKITILQVSRATLDRLMVLEEKEKTDGLLDGDSEMEVSDIGEEDSGDWMTTMLQSELFSRLPTANIHQLFALLEEVEAKAGDTIIKQGDVGDQYYIIQTGRCEVTRSPSEGAKPIKLAELRGGDSFGEEALLTDAKRNASINMLTDGILMQLSKDNFINLIKKPTLGTVSYGKAKELIEQGACWMDVRFKNEYEESNIEGSINIPLNVLRTQTDKLESNKQYVICCDTGGRSSAATFLLAQRGFNVCYLEGGLVSTPEVAKAKEVTEKIKPAEDKKEEAKKEVADESDIDP